MTPGYFRTLLLVSVVACFAGSIVDLVLPPSVSAELSAAVENEPFPLLLAQGPWVSLAMLLPFPVAGIAGAIGMFFFRRWARTLSLAVLAIGFAVGPFLGPSLSSGLSSALIEFAATTWGAVIAIAYFSPLSQRFLPPVSVESNHVR